MSIRPDYRLLDDGREHANQVEILRENLTKLGDQLVSDAYDIAFEERRQFEVIREVLGLVEQVSDEFWGPAAK